MTVITNTTYFGLHSTVEEIAIWYDRCLHGPYKVHAANGAGSPGDGDKIKQQADAFKANRNTYQYNNYYKGAPTVACPRGAGSTTTQYDPQLGDYLQDCALWYIMSGDTSYGNPARDSILDTVYGTGYASYTISGVAYKAFDFTNKARWPDAGFDDVNPGFVMCEWLLYMLHSYEYVAGLMTPTQRTDCITWWKTVALWAIPYTVGYVDSFFVKKGLARITSMDYTMDSTKTDEQLTGSTQSMYFGSPPVHKLERAYGNRRILFALLVGELGIFLGIDGHKQIAEQHFKELFMFSIFPGGHYCDFHRGISSSPYTGGNLLPSNKGYDYAALFAPLQYADAAARKGDPSFFNWTTTFGSMSPAMNTAKPGQKRPITGGGGQSSDDVTLKGLKPFVYTMMGLRLHIGNGSNLGVAWVPIYAVDSSSQTPNGTTRPVPNAGNNFNSNAYLIDGVNRTTKQEQSVTDCYYGPAANFFDDVLIETAVLRTHVNATPWPNTPQVAGTYPGFSGSIMSGCILQYAGMRTIIRPYPGSASTLKSQNITFPTVSGITYGQTVTLGATTDAVGLTVTYTLDPLSTAKGTFAGSVFTPTQAGNAIINADQGGGSGYSAATRKSQTFTVAKKLLTGTIASVIRTFNQTNPTTYAISYTGFVGSDTAVTIDTPPTITNSITNSANAGTYTNVITGSGGLDNNYIFTFIAGNLTINKGTLSLSTSTNLNKVTSDADFTIVINPVIAGTSTAVTGLTITFALTSGTSVATVTTGGSVHLDGTITGNSVITASVATNTNYNTTSIALTVGVNSAALIAQTITFNSLSAVTYGAAAGTLSASSTSLLTVQFSSSDSTIATCTGTNGATITYLKAGSVDIYADQPGNGTYSAAPRQKQTLTINKKTLTVTGTANTKIYGDAIPPLAYVISGGYVGSDSSASFLTQPIVTTNCLQFSAAGGTYSVIPSGGSAANYTFSYVNGAFTVSKRSQTITLLDIADKRSNDAQFLLQGTADSGLPLTWSITAGGTIGSITGSQFTLQGTNTGSVTVRADQAGNTNYNPATFQTKSFTVNGPLPIPQNITISPIDTQIFGEPDFDVNATSDAPGLIVSVAVVAGTGVLAGSTCPTTCSVGDAGILTLRFTQAGDSGHIAATPQQYDVTINKKPQIITADTIPDFFLSDLSTNIIATVDSGKLLQITVDTPMTLAQPIFGGSLVNFLAIGAAAVSIRQDGDSNYGAAEIKRMFNINPDPGDALVEFLASATLVKTKEPYPITGQVTRTLYKWAYNYSSNYLINRIVLTFTPLNPVKRIEVKGRVSGVSQPIINKIDNTLTVLDITLDIAKRAEGYLEVTAIGANLNILLVKVEAFGVIV